MKSINKTTKTFMFSLFKAVAVLPMFAFGQQSFTLDNAIAESMDFFSGKLSPGSKIAVLKVEAPNKELSEYITVECENYILTNTQQTLSGKKGLVAILKKRNIDDINKAADADVLSAGRLLGAKTVIIIEFSKYNEEYTFLIYGFDTETSQNKGTLALKVELDAVLADFMGEHYVPPSKNSDAMALRKELTDIKTELSEIKETVATQQTVSQELFSALQENTEPAAIETKEVVEVIENTYFVFSLRPEFRPLTTVGGNIEFGNIGAGSFYFSVDGGGGICINDIENYYYYGGGLNFGGCINKDGGVKNVLGIYAGFWLNSNKHSNDYTFGGFTWKWLFGRTGNFDITHKALFGMSDKDSYNDFTASYSLSIGYTLTKKRKK